MLPCSVRRVAATAPQSSIIVSALPRTSSTSITRSFKPNPCRRYSSSKPSRDNGPEASPVRQSVQPSAESKTSEAKPSGEKRKRKTKDASDKLKYPSVPTTAHIPSDFLALSSFFSLHRPISVTRGLPRNVTDDAFATIFATPARGQKTSEVISTISRTVEELEQPMASLSVQQQQQSPQQPDAVATSQAFDQAAMQMRNPDGSETSVTLQVQNMSGQFLPFRPPPLPLPESASRARNSAKDAIETSGAGAAVGQDAAAQQDAQTRVYKAVFTIEETTDANGEVKIMAHSPELIEEEGSDEGAEGLSTSAATEPEDIFTPRTFLERMALRQLRYDDARSQRATLWAISVKRQRKLKMKKKKYKKLTKRLRHERLKHGRT